MIDSPMTAIEKPWIIMHETEDGKLQCVLAGPDGAGHEQFSIVIADLIRHVSNHFSVDEADVLNWIEREVNSPTTDLERVLQS